MELKQALAHWPQADFMHVLKRELEGLPAEQLPLQQALALAATVSASPFTATIYNTEDDSRFIYARVGILYNGLISGCSCSDDPSPDSETNEYCLLQLSIDKASAQTQIELLDA